MMRRVSPLILAVVLIAASCGGDDAATAQTGAGTETATAASSTSPDTTETGPAPGDDAARIETLLARFDETSLRTTYRVSDGPDRQIIVFSQDPTRDPPASAMIIGEDEGRIITIGDTTILCGPGAAGEAQCLESPAAPPGVSLTEGILGPVLAGFLFAEGVTDNPAFGVREEPAEYAGRSGICFTITPVGPGDMDFIVQCIDAELGFTLAVKEQATGSDPQVVLELIEFGPPRPDDFEPTGPVSAPPGS